MHDTAIPKKLYGKLYATRRRRKPKMRWLDDVPTDLRKMGINEERQSKGSRGLEAYFKGGQGPPRTVAPQKKKIKSEVFSRYYSFVLWTKINIFVSETFTIQPVDSQ
jgi:hypothetical protein